MSGKETLKGFIILWLFFAVVGWVAYNFTPTSQNSDNPKTDCIVNLTCDGQYDR